MIKIAMNGITSEQENPYVPISVEQYLHEMTWFMEHDISNFHIHFRDEAGIDTLEQGCVQPQFDRLKKAFPTCRVGIGSPLFYGRTNELRMRQVREWTWRPDYISVNVCEEGSAGFAKLLQEKGVPIEYGIFTLDDAMAYVQKGFVRSTFRVLIEVSGHGSGAESVAKADEIYRYLYGIYPQVDYLLHGEDIYTWDIIRFAQEKGLNYRIGFEDIDRDQAGNRFKSNVELYRHGVGLTK